MRGRIGSMELRPLTEADLPMTLAWRNREWTRSMLFSGDVVSEETHWAWFKRYQDDPHDLVLIGEVYGKPVAQVSIYGMDPAARSAEFGRLVVSERGNGYARLATWGAIRLAFRQLQLSELHLRVRGTNAPAVRLYLESGFQLVGWNGEHASMALRSRERWWDNWDCGGGAPAAAVLDFWRKPDEVAWRQMLAHKVIPLLGDGTCEVGCGSGLVLDALRQCGWRGDYTGYDTSYSMLAEALAVSSDEGEQLSYGDAFALPASNNAFDSAFCFEVFGHIPEIVQPIRELYRVVRKHAVFTVWIGKAETKTVEDHAGQTFLHAERTLDQVMETVRDACPPGTLCTHEAWSGSTYAFVIHKDCDCSP